MKVLILGAAAVQNDAIQFLNEAGVETHVCAKSADGPGVQSAKKFESIDILDIDKVKKYVIDNNINAVYSIGSDISMPIASKISEELLLPQFVSSEVAIKCNNKDLMRIALGSETIGNVPFEVMEDNSNKPKVDFPFIMKPTDSQGQRGVTLVNTIEEYIENFEKVKCFSRSGKVIVERYIRGEEVSVNAYIVNNELKFMEISDRITWSQYTGLIHKHIVPTSYNDHELTNKMKNVIISACEKIGINNGPAYFQMKIENNTPYIIEMTPRLDGCHMWELLKHYTQVDLIKLTFEHLLYKKTSELERYFVDSSKFQLEFFCQKPNTIMDQNNFNIPKKHLNYNFYYQSGDKIRPVNGKFDKVGYLITKE